MMNSRRLLGQDLPSGLNRVKWNVLMVLALTFAITVSIVSIYQSDSTKQLIGFGSLAAIAVLSLIFRARHDGAAAADSSASAN